MSQSLRNDSGSTPRWWWRWWPTGDQATADDHMGAAMRWMGVSIAGFTVSIVATIVGHLT